MTHFVGWARLLESETVFFKHENYRALGNISFGSLGSNWPSSGNQSSWRRLALSLGRADLLPYQYFLGIFLKINDFASRNFERRTFFNRDQRCDA